MIKANDDGTPDEMKKGEETYVLMWVNKNGISNDSDYIDTVDFFPASIKKLVENQMPVETQIPKQDEMILIYVHTFLENLKKEPNMMFQMGLAMRLIQDLTRLK